MELTDAAQALVREAPHLHAADERARNALADAADERARSALADAADPQTGQVRIAAHAFAVSSIVLPALPSWQERHPRSRWALRESEPANAQRLLTSREADLVVMPAGPHTPAADHPRFTVRRLVVEPVDLIIGRSHPLAAGLGVSFMPRRAPTHPDVVRVPLSGPIAPVRTILMVMRRGSESWSLLADTMEALTMTAVARVQRPLDAGADAREGL